MQDIAPSPERLGRSYDAPFTIKNARLSATTITPDLIKGASVSIEEEKDPSHLLPLSSADSYSAAIGSYNLTQSHYFQDPQTVSTQDTDDCYSSSENRCRSDLLRSDTSLSSVSTSPETEFPFIHNLSQKVVQPISNDEEAIAPSAHLLGDPKVSPSIMRESSLRSDLTSTSQAEQTDDDRRLVELSAIAYPTIWASEEEVMPSAKPVSRDFLSASNSLSSLSHRNKPLPIPAELSATPTATRIYQSSIPQTSSSLLPSLSISPAVKQADLARDESFRPLSPTSLIHEVKVDTSHRMSFRSMLNRSSNAFRSSTAPRSSSPAKIGVSKSSGSSTAGTQSKQRSPQLGLFSSSGFRLENSPDTESQRWLSPTDPSPSSQQETSSPEVIQSSTKSPFSSSTSPSSYNFRRGNSWLGGSRFDFIQESHLKTPSSAWKSTSQLSSSASSSSSRESSGSDMKLGKRFIKSTLSPFTRSHRVDLDDTFSKTEANEKTVRGVNAGRESASVRPPLYRYRSKSMDVMERFKSDPRVIDLRDSDSIAVGTTSVIDVNLPDQRVDTDKLQENDKTFERSRFSKFLTRKPSAPSLQGDELRSSTSMGLHSTKGDQLLSLQHTAPREGTLSRLTDSLRGKRSKSTVKSKDDLTKSSKPVSLPVKAVTHQRHRSTGSTSVFVIAQSDVEAAESKRPLSSDPNSFNSAHKPDGSFGGDLALNDVADSKTTLNGLNQSVASLATQRKDPLSKHSKSPYLSNELVMAGDDEARVKAGSHSRELSSELDDDFVSATSMTPSTSDQALAHYGSEYDDTVWKGTDPSSEQSAGHLRQAASRGTSPSSYRAPNLERLSRMTKSESDPALDLLSSSKEKYIKNHHSVSALKVASSSQPSRRSTTGSREVPAGLTSKSFNGLAFEKATPSSTEEKALPPIRSSSHAAIKGNQTKTTAQRTRSSGKRSLKIDIKGATVVSVPEVPVRPSSALGMTADLERGAQKTAAGAGGAALQAQKRRPSQATLNIADDLEFLHALEHVRKVNQERIKKQDEDVNRVQQMARMGMASTNKKVKGRESHRKSSGNIPPRTALVRRTSSADGRMNSKARSSSNKLDSESTKSKDSTSSPSGDTIFETPSALELGVGKASGKMQDGAFINDDDWKREVKALFVIREMVLTERSYARHLEALLQSVRALYPTVKKTTNSHSSRSIGQVPTHITIMRNLLPQLIALSRSLANRIDENPTAAGVGTAFRLVSSQMEATFIAWSSVITDVLEALRNSEKSKGKAKDRIGLITLRPLEHLDSVKPSQINGFVSVPCSPTLTSTPLQVSSHETEAQSSSESALVESPTALTFEESKSSARLAPSTKSRRRSTLSGLSPGLVSSLRAKATGSVSNEQASKTADDVKTPSTSHSLGKRVIDTMVSTKLNHIPSKPRTRSDSSPFDSSTRTSLTKSTSSFHVFTSGYISNTPTKSSSSSDLTSFASKRLSALDVAIMPTQRIPRYLLLLRDLNMNTPPQSLSHIRLQRCLDFVTRVARNCDRASRATAA